LKSHSVSLQRVRFARRQRIERLPLNASLALIQSDDECVCAEGFHFSLSPARSKEQRESRKRSKAATRGESAKVDAGMVIDQSGSFSARVCVCLCDAKSLVRSLTLH
jgi:hypothetical protein